MKIPGSSPGTLPYNSIFIEYKILFGWIAKWLNAPDCKSGGSAFEGSNPSPSIYRTTVLFYYSSLFFVFFVFMIISPSWASVQRLGM